MRPKKECGVIGFFLFKAQLLGYLFIFGWGVSRDHHGNTLPAGLWHCVPQLQVKASSREWRGEAKKSCLRRQHLGKLVEHADT